MFSILSLLFFCHCHFYVSACFQYYHCFFVSPGFLLFYYCCFFVVLANAIVIGYRFCYYYHCYCIRVVVIIITGVRVDVDVIIIVLILLLPILHYCLILFYGSFDFIKFNFTINFCNYYSVALLHFILFYRELSIWRFLSV